MKVGRINNWYNPWFAVVGNGNKSVKLSCIKFYDDSGVVCRTNSGWIDGLDELELETEQIKLRRNIKFDGEVFVVSDPHTPSYEDTKNYILYIPADMFNVHHVYNELIKNIWQVYSVYEGDDGIRIRQYIKSIDGKLHDIRCEYNDIRTLCDDYSMHKDVDGVISNIDHMRKLAEEYRAEELRLKSLTIDDIEL